MLLFPGSIVLFFLYFLFHGPIFFYLSSLPFDSSFSLSFSRNNERNFCEGLCVQVKKPFPLLFFSANSIIFSLDMGFLGFFLSTYFFFFFFYPSSFAMRIYKIKRKKIRTIRHLIHYTLSSSVADLFPISWLIWYRKERKNEIWRLALSTLGYELLLLLYFQKQNKILNISR